MNSQAIAALPLLLGGLLFSSSLLGKELVPTGVKPEPLALEAPLPKPGSLLRRLGHEGGAPMGEVGSAKWMPDGSRLLTSNRYLGSNLIQCWKPNAEGNAVSFDGSYALNEPWTISPDGKMIVGNRPKSGGGENLELHRLDTHEGVWAIANTGQFFDVEFSQDGRWLATCCYERQDLANAYDYVLYVVDTQTGQCVYSTRMGPYGRDVHRIPAHYIAMGKDSIWLAPSLNQDGQVTRISLGDWKKTLVSDPAVDRESEQNLFLSPDEKWIVLWNRDSYRVVQMAGDKLALRFGGEAETTPFRSCGFNSVRISPDSTLLTISGNGKSKVIDLLAQKVVHEDTKTCLCGFFSPDGRTFWNTCESFRPIDTRTWTFTPEKTPGHRGDVKFVEFSPDGTRLASMSRECIYVWSVDGSTPPRRLEPAAGRHLLDMEWKPDGTEIWSADGKDFIRWQLSEPLIPGQAQIAKKLFPGTKANWVEAPERQMIKAIPGSNKCYLFSMDGELNSYRQYEEVRDPSRPEIFQSVGGKGTSKGYLRFSTSGKEIFHTQNDTVTAFNWTDATERKGMYLEKGVSLAGGGEHSPLVLIDSKKIMLVDPTTLQSIKTITPPADCYFNNVPQNKRGCMTRDGQWLVCFAGHIRAFASKPSMLMVNIKDKGEAYPLPPVGNSRISGAFSPNGRMLAFGHQGGLVSVWDVERIKTESAPQLPAEAPPQQNRMFGTRLDEKILEWPGQEFPLTKGDAWTLTDDGGLRSSVAGIHAGQLLINGQPPKTLSRSLRLLTASKNNVAPNGPSPIPLAPGRLYGELEFRNSDDKVRVNRHFSGVSSGSSEWLDTVENISAESVVVKLAYDTGLGGPAAGLRMRNSQIPSVSPDGSLKAEGPITELGMLTEIDGTERIASIAFSTPSAENQPILRWDEQRQSIIKEWTLRLRPFERRLVLLQFTQYRKSEGYHPPISRLSLFQGGPISRVPAFLNYTIDPEEERLLDRSFKTYGLEPNGTVQDTLGFRWRPALSPTYGMGADLGADRILDIWLGGSPAIAAAYSLSPETVSAKYPRQCTSVDGTIKSNRRHLWTRNDGILMIHDEITNAGTSAAEVRVALSTVALNNFVQVVNTQGKPLDCTSPLPFKDTGGQVALISEGTTKPAILLGLGKPTAKVQPTVRFVAGRGFFVGYLVKLAPGESTSLLHFATQRPFSAFDSPSSAFDELDLSYALGITRAQKWPTPANW